MDITGHILLPASHNPETHFKVECMNVGMSVEMKRFSNVLSQWMKWVPFLKSTNFAY